MFLQLATSKILFPFMGRLNIRPINDTIDNLMKDKIDSDYQQSSICATLLPLFYHW